MDIILPDWDDAPPNVNAFVTTRAGGVSRPPFDDGAGGGGMNLGLHVGDDAQAVMQNRARLRSKLPAEPAWLTQVHGNTVIDAGSITADGEAVSADASFAAKPGAVCVIQTADCLPVLFCDVAGKVVGAAHAGWRGLAAGVLENTLSRMRAAGAAEILAWLGPAIGPERFEVGADVLAAFVRYGEHAKTAFTPLEGKNGKYLADIYQLARLVLNQAGVKRISGGAFCTVNDARRFYSYRRDKITGRMAAFIWCK